MLKTLQNFVKIGENVKIPLYLELRSFKTPLYLVLIGPQNNENIDKKTLPPTNKFYPQLMISTLNYYILPPTNWFLAEIGVPEI